MRPRAIIDRTAATAGLTAVERPVHGDGPEFATAQASGGASARPWRSGASGGRPVPVPRPPAATRPDRPDFDAADLAAVAALARIATLRGTSRARSPGLGRLPAPARAFARVTRGFGAAFKALP